MRIDADKEYFWFPISVVDHGFDVLSMLLVVFPSAYWFEISPYHCDTKNAQGEEIKK